MMVFEVERRPTLDMRCQTKDRLADCFGTECYFITDLATVTRMLRMRDKRNKINTEKIG